MNFFRIASAGEFKALLYLCFSLLFTPSLIGQISIKGQPIDYFNKSVKDPISKLQKKLDQGELTLEYDKNFGYLNSLLKHLNIDASSQVLVFSKTSFQLKKISPRTPRALYFGDDSYIGWVRGGEVLEISSVDPKQGAIFYTLEQKRVDRPKFIRHNHECLQCHSSTLTKGVPGHLVRSVYTFQDGQLDLRAGTSLTDHSSPLRERWGGWYVTGSHGSQRHMGNSFVQASEIPGTIDRETGANLKNLKSLFDSDPYLTPHSDIVSLMVLEHQTQVHNLITRANYLTRLASNDDKVINEMLGRPLEERSESSKRRIERAGEALLEQLLCYKGITLTAPISGTSGYSKYFSSSPIRDSKGRSLYQLDLKSRLFKYRLSYLIYSEAFDTLPKELKNFVYKRLWGILNHRDSSGKFSYLQKNEAQAILEILRETKSTLPSYYSENKEQAQGKAALRKDSF